jgi:hypothetical protein
MTAAIIFAACGRSDDEVTSTSAPAATNATEPGTDTTLPTAVGLDEGGFGDLGVICSPAAAGTELTDTDVGVTADSIQVSTFSDPGFVGRPGLNQEMFDTATAFAAWCNEHGGINGREIDLKLRDAKLGEFQQRIIEACSEGDFAMVGGGAVFDDTGQAERLDCELPNIAGYVVTAVAAEADLTVQPVPNPAGFLPTGDLDYLAAQFPDSLDHVGILTGDIATTVTVASRYREGIETLGWDEVYYAEYPAGGVDNWRPYLEEIESKGVEGLVWVGEPVNLGKFMDEADGLGIEFAWVRTDANHYDNKLIAEAGAAADGAYIRSVFAPFLGGAAEPGSAPEQYTQLIEQYVDGGIQAYLGEQGLSGWLLFATAARDCGAELTRDCMYANAAAQTEWSGGGLHAPIDLSSGSSPDCFDLFVVEGGEFTLADISPNNGIYSCSADNVIALTGDYGEGAKCPNAAYADDPKPSNCGTD